MTKQIHKRGNALLAALLALLFAVSTCVVSVAAESVQAHLYVAQLLIGDADPMTVTGYYAVIPQEGQEDNPLMKDENGNTIDGPFTLTGNQYKEGWFTFTEPGVYEYIGGKLKDGQKDGTITKDSFEEGTKDYPLTHVFGFKVVRNADGTLTAIPYTCEDNQATFFKDGRGMSLWNYVEAYAPEQEGCTCKDQKKCDCENGGCKCGDKSGCNCNNNNNNSQSQSQEQNQNSNNENNNNNSNGGNSNSNSNSNQNGDINIVINNGGQNSSDSNSGSDNNSSNNNSNSSSSDNNSSNNSSSDSSSNSSSDNGTAKYEPVLDNNNEPSKNSKTGQTNTTVTSTNSNGNANGNSNVNSNSNSSKGSSTGKKAGGTNTGDPLQLGLWIGILAVAAAGLLIILLVKRRNREDDEENS